VAIQVTHIRLSGVTPTHQHITDYMWRSSDDTGAVNSSSKRSMVECLDKPGTAAYVSSGTARAAVAVIRPEGREPYLRTYADGVWSDNLLSLPRF
jgi:hypothetical protein